MLLSTALISIAIAFIEGLPLVKKKMWKEFCVLIILLLTAVLLVIGKMLNIPNIINVLDGLLYPLGRSIYRQR